MKHQINRIGYWSGLLAFTATISYCIVQLLQVYGILHFPLDEKMIYGTSLCIVIPFLLEILALHYTTPANKKFWSNAALTFAILYAVFVTANYVVQLATVIPMELKGQLNEIRVLKQTPHSMFWNFDALGYIFMGLTTGCSIPIFNGSGFQKSVRISLIANTLTIPFISIVYFYPTYSYNLLAFGFAWGITAPLFMLLLAINFRKNKQEQKHSKTIRDIHSSLTIHY